MNIFKINKKLVASFLVVFFGMLFLLPKLSLADSRLFNGTTDWRNVKSYTLTSPSTITVSGFPSGHPAVKFVDSVPGDKTYNYMADTSNHDGLCGGSITFKSGSTPSSKSIDATINIHFENSQGPTTCPAGNSSPYGPADIKITNGINVDTGPATITYKGATYKQIDKNAYPQAYGLSAKVGTDCYGGSLLVLDNVDTKASGGVTGTVVGAVVNGGLDLTNLVNLPNGFPLDSDGGNGRCEYNVNGNAADVTVSTAGVAKFKECPSFAQNCPDAPNAAAASPTSIDTSACVASGSTGLEWLLCPITTALSKGADQINSQVEKQLNFDIKDNLQESGVHQSWTIIKDIASAMVVILLLVMVLAQALNFQLIDAYTIKKMLPKLVIAVIFMQLSWDICIWLIQLANDAGQGIKQIMVLPFGGNGGNMDLNSILNVLSPNWASASQGILPIAALIGLIIGAIVLPAAFVFIFSVFIGVFAAFMVLLFRNVLIVALTIFAPLAFLAWTVPSGANVWKMWKDNFTKLLMMFPLLIAIIYVGRDFAWIVAKSHGGHAGLIDYLTVMVAYFGPYFVIFKAYQWGGGLMKAAGTGIASARKGITNANRGWLETLGKRAQGNIAMKYTQADEASRKAYEKVGKYNDRMDALQKRIEKRKEEGGDTTALERGMERMKRGKAAALQAQQEVERKNGRGRRALYRIGAGKPIWWSSRNQLETLARGGEYKEELVKQKMAKIHDDYTSQLNATGSVSKAKEYIRDKYGFGNMKLDDQGNMTRDAKDVLTERAFWNWVVDTKSAMELGDTNWRTDNGTKIDLAKTKGFLGMMNADPNRYAYVAQNLPELQPFNQAIGGGPKPEDFRVGTKAFRELEKRDANAAQVIRLGLAAGATADQQAAALEMMELQANDSRYTKMQKNLEHTSDLAVWRPEQLQMMADNIRRMKRAGASTSQAEEEFKTIMKRLAASSTPEARSTLQRLMGGERSAIGAVNEVMGDRWLEDTLDLPTEVGEIRRTTALPRAGEEDEYDVKLMEVDARGNPGKVAIETARAMAEGGGYTTKAHGKEHIDVEANFDRNRNNIEASHNREAIIKTNNIIDTSIQFVEEKAQRLIRQAAQSGRYTPAQLQVWEERISQAARARADRLRAKKIPLPASADDPTVMIVSHSPESPAPNPIDLRVQIQSTLARQLPPPALLTAAGTPDWENLKMQLRGNPQLTELIARGIAYGVAPSQYEAVLEDMRNEALHGSRRDQQAYNRIAELIQKSIQQRVEEEVAHAIQTGLSPAIARQNVMTATDPVTGRTFGEEIMDYMPGGGSPLKLFPV